MFVLFIDILGFAHNIETLSIDEHALLSTIILQHDWRADILKDGKTIKDLSEKGTKVYQDYKNFHEIINKVLKENMESRNLQNDYQPITTAVFSDSVFVASEGYEMVFGVAAKILDSAFEKLLPVRGGIGFGTFTSFSFSVSAQANGTLHLEAPFIGSAVVRSYRAESNGAKGIRIFIHPTTVSELKKYTNWNPNSIIPLPEEEANENASHEIVSAWERVGYEDWEKHQDNLLKIMKSRAPSFAAKQYDDTLSALQRMRAR